MGLNVKFQGLVDQQDKEDQQGYFISFFQVVVVILYNRAAKKRRFGENRVRLFSFGLFGPA
jgi:hypothetical protein